MQSRKIKVTSSLILLVISLTICSSCNRKPVEGSLIITLVDKQNESPDYLTGKNWRYINRTRLAIIDPAKPEKSFQLLTQDFFSASSPDISYDGGKMVFAGQKEENDIWQIWEMDLHSMKTRQLTSANENSIDPSYLPGGTILFSSSPVNDSLKSGHSLYTCKADGNDIKRITFNPHTYFASSVLKDGRILTVSRQNFPVRGSSTFMVLRPDGTKCELFYKGDEGRNLISKGLETESGSVLFIESDDSMSIGGDIISIKYNRPLHSRINLTESGGGKFYSAYPLKAGMLIVSCRPSENEPVALYEYDLSTMKIGRKIFSYTGNEIIDAVPVRAHEKQKKLPSEVDSGAKTGLLLCQNINVSGLQSPEIMQTKLNATRIEIMGIDSSLGVIDVEKDGSVYLKITADMPFRIKTIDSEGKVVSGPGSWLWIRPNERRGCVGCHEDNEMVPANRLANAVKKAPVAVPVHLSGIKEKNIELE